MSKKLNWILIVISIVVLIVAIYLFIDPSLFTNKLNEIKNDNSLGEKQKMAEGMAITFDVFIVKYFSLSVIITAPIVLFLLIRNLTKAKT